MKRYRLKKDRFQRMKGGISRILAVCCGRCGTQVVVYQKDGIGRLKRCYLDRILDPPGLASLESNPRVTAPKFMPQLACTKCANILGVPTRHHSGRLAFHLLAGAFSKRAWKGDQVETEENGGVDGGVVANGFGLRVASGSAAPAERSV